MSTTLNVPVKFTGKQMPPKNIIFDDTSQKRRTLAFFETALYVVNI